MRGGTTADTRVSLAQDKGYFFRREGRRGRKGGDRHTHLCSDTKPRNSRTDSLHFLCEKKVFP